MYGGGVNTGDGCVIYWKNNDRIPWGFLANQVGADAFKMVPDWPEFTILAYQPYIATGRF